MTTRYLTPFLVAVALAGLGTVARADATLTIVTRDAGGVEIGLAREDPGTAKVEVYDKRVSNTPEMVLKKGGDPYYAPSTGTTVLKLVYTVKDSAKLFIQKGNTTAFVTFAGGLMGSTTVKDLMTAGLPITVDGATITIR